MIRKISGKMSSVFLAALLAVSGISGVFAVPAFAEEETEEEDAGKETLEVAVTQDGGTATLVNDTDISVTDLSYISAADEGASGSLVVTQSDGSEHTFEDMDLEEGADLTLLEKIGFLYITQTQNGEDVWYYENAPETTLQEPVTMYALTRVNIRESMDTSSESLGQAETGSEVKVTGGTPEWFAVTDDDVSGYIAARYLTADEEDLEEAQNEDAARTEAEEAALAAAQEAAGGSDTSVYDDADAYASDAGGYYYEDTSVYDDADAYASDAGGYSDDADAYASDAGTYVESVYDCDGSGSGYNVYLDADGNEYYEDF